MAWVDGLAPAPVRCSAGRKLFVRSFRPPRDTRLAGIRKKKARGLAAPAASRRQASAVDPRLTPNVLYVGNDSGVYVSSDAGVTWSRFQSGLSNVQVIELKFNTDLNLLVAATHGRGVWEILLQ